MGNNQNDQRNQDKTGNKSKTNEDGIKKETNPNNPTANQGNRPGSQQNNQQRQDTPSGKMDEDVRDIEKKKNESSEEELMEESKDEKQPYASDPIRK